MKTEEKIRLLIGAAIIALYFIILRELPRAIGSIFVVVVIWVIIGVLIAPPLAGLISDKLVSPLFGERAGKVTKEYSKAKGLAAQGRFEEAIEEYRRGLDKEPQNVMLRLEIAEICSRDMKDFRRAISELEECLKLKLGPTQGASILNRIADICETNLGDTEGAMAALRRIQESWPGTKLAQRAYERLQTMGEPTHNPRR